MNRTRAWCVWVLVALLVACGGGGGGPAAESAAVAQVEIRQTGLLLTGAGSSRQLEAVTTDAQGRVVDAPLTWRSSNPAAAAVDSAGRVTAMAASGSAQITVQAQGVSSPPLLVAVVVPPAGAMLLEDAQIVGDPVETDPNAAPSFANTYRVVLTGTDAPGIGQLLLNTESKAVGGEVVAVDSVDGTHSVTLKLVPARVLLPGLDLNETFDLSRAPVAFSAELAARYDIARSGNTYTFTPRPGAFGGDAARERALAATGTSALPPFTSCEKTLTGAGTSLPIALAAPPLFSVTISPSLDVRYSPVNGLERFVVQAEPVFKIEGGLNVIAAFEGKVECKLELFAFRVPVGGPLSLIVGGLVPVGVGLEAGGKVTVATLGIGSKVELKAKAQAGLSCPGGTGCEFVRSWSDTTLKYTPTLDLPSIGDLRVEPTLMAFGYVQAEIGNPFLRRIRFEAFKARAGGKLAGSFAPMISQITDTNYQSDYKVSLEASAGVGADLEGAVQLLGLGSVSSLELTISTDLARSPVGTVTADRASFRPGDAVNFTVRFDPTHKDFLAIYNIARVLLVRKDALSGTVVAVTSASASAAAAGQTEFVVPYTATALGSASEFTAFVVTTLAPLQIVALELDKTLARGYEVAVQMPTNMAAGSSATVNVTVTQTDGLGGRSPAAGLLLVATASNGTVSPGSATTSAQGTAAFTVSASPAPNGDLVVEFELRLDAASSPLGYGGARASVSVTPPPDPTLQQRLIGRYAVQLTCGSVTWGEGFADVTADGEGIAVSWNVVLALPSSMSGGLCGDAYRRSQFPTSGSFAGMPAVQSNGTVELVLSRWNASPCINPNLAPPTTTPLYPSSNALLIPFGAYCVPGEIVGSTRYMATKLVSP